MNTITIAGRLTRDAETRQAGSEQVTSFSVAETIKDKNGERPQFFDCSMWGQRGEKIRQYLTKGSPVTVTGSLTTREHGGKFYLQLRVGDVALQGSKKDGASGGYSNSSGSAAKNSAPADDGFNDADPFGDL